MPVPGPRTQHGPDPGFRNPEHSAPTFFNHWDRPGPIWWPGRSPGMMVRTLRGNVLGAGQIRKLYKQAVNYVPAQAPYSWTKSAPAPDRGVLSPEGFHITVGYRYLTRSVYKRGGEDNTRFAALHTVVRKRNAYKTVTVNAGQKRNPPTVRNRITSFGSRVPTLNAAIPAAEAQNPGVASQA